MSRIIEDPRIEGVAKIEALRLWAEIEARLYSTDFDFFHLREQVLAAHVPKIAKTFGKEVARRVEAAIMSRDPSTASESVAKRRKDMLRGAAIARHGRLRKRDRVSLWLFGMPLS
jgi:hypothetical protein